MFSTRPYEPWFFEQVFAAFQETWTIKFHAFVITGVFDLADVFHKKAQLLSFFISASLYQFLDKLTL